MKKKIVMRALFSFSLFNYVRSCLSHQNYLIKLFGNLGLSFQEYNAKCEPFGIVYRYSGLKRGIEIRGSKCK